MTLITRLITNERTIFFADGRITSQLNDKYNIISNDERKLIILPYAIIGISGAFDFGKWLLQRVMGQLKGKAEFNVYNVVSDYINDNKIESSDADTIFSLGNHLKDCVNAAHPENYLSTRPSDITLLVTISNEIMQHFRIIIRKTYGPYTCDIFELGSDIKDYDFDTNLYQSINNHEFKELLDQVANEIFQVSLNGELINNMTDKSILEFGNLLYDKFDIQYKNQRVGNLNMHAVL